MSVLVVERPSYRLELAADGRFARLATRAGELALRPMAAFDTLDGLDETVSVAPPRALGDGRFEVDRRSTRWERASVTLTCGDDTIDVVASVEGRGSLADVHLLAGRGATGYLPSGSSFTALFSPAPEDPARILRSARERVALGVVGDGEPGRGHWFFTPPPLVLALTSDEDEWLSLGVAAPVEALTFPQLVYQGGDRAFALKLEYEGRTPVDGAFAAPTLVVSPGHAGPNEALRRHRDHLVARRAAPAPSARERAAWWTEPIFCGWGAQSARARTVGGRAPDHSTRENYDAFLEHLERQGIVPGTVVLDDKWQSAYGTNEPDLEKWPDLRGWIAARHERGQRVLLWWKAWDPEEVPVEHCVRDREGMVVALDPTNPAARERLAASVTRMLGADGLDADGLKVDFTARTPSGSSLTTHGPGWGIALLHELLATVHGAAKAAKPDALLITHTPHPAFVDVADMIRLNDQLRLDDSGPRPHIVPQMRYRAEVVSAVCSDLLVDTDDWCAPDLAQWREYLEMKSLLGVPSLYYAQSLDATNEQFEQRDYDSLRETWERWRATAR